MVLRQLAAGLVALRARPDGGAIERLRRRADALDAVGRVSLDRTDLIRDGLREAVDAVRGATPDDGGRRLEAWIAAASAAVDALDPQWPAALYRAAIQDALRATADAVLVAHEIAAGGGRGKAAVQE